MVRHSGFWVRQCLPARRIAIVAAAWVWSGVETVKASTSRSRWIISRKSLYRRALGYARYDPAAASSSTSHSATTFAPNEVCSGVKR